MRLGNRNERPRIYVAGPLFSAAERSFNLFLKQQLSDFFTVYLPQEDGALMPDLIQSGLDPLRAAELVFSTDLEAIREAIVVLILLDGRSVDEGASFELGVAYALGKRCIGLQTDFRRLAPFGNNPMLVGALERVFESTETLLDWCRESYLTPSTMEAGLQV